MRNIDRDVNYPEKKYLMVEQGIEGMANCGLQKVNIPVAFAKMSPQPYQ